MRTTLILMLLATVAACGGPSGPASDAGEAPAAGAAPAAPVAPAVPTGDNSRNALDWPGVYTGTVPCADCAGIRTRIELRSDGSFARSLVYLGRDAQPLDDEGSFEWDAAGARITLAASRDPQRYQVGENVLFHLDREGQRITGDLAAAYRLEKIVNDPRLEDRRWQLVELAGQAVETTPGSEGAYFELESAQSRVSGNASCNRFSGPYELRAGGRLRLGPEFATTRMACPDLERESALLDVLARADSYTIAQGQLALNVARMAPLARFVETGN